MTANPPHQVRGQSDLWAGVDRLIDRAPSLADLLEHRIHLLAARRWRTVGRTIPRELIDEERRAALATLTAPVLLERAQAVYNGPMILFKGPEVAARYPDPELRPFIDVDLLIPDAAEAQRALLTGGFVEVGDPELFDDIHHLRPLAWPTLPLWIEIHTFPKWLEGLPPPSIEELLAAAVPASSSPDGVLTLPPAHHALVLAVHSWAHEPLRRLLELIDVAAIADGADRAEIALLARRWGVERVWTATLAAADALLLGERIPWSLRLWARNLREARGRTVLESHLQHWLSSFWMLPPRPASRATGRRLARDLRPAPYESWGSKLSRTRRALSNAPMRRSEHDRLLEREGLPTSPRSRNVR